MSKRWNYGILDDVVDKGSSNISLNKIKEEVGDYPVFGAKGFMKNVSFYQQEKEYLGIIKDGAGIGRVSKHPAKSSILATMQYIIPKEDYEIDFIRYFLESLDFENYRTGSTIPHIYYKDYKSAKFPLVDIKEQKQIVTLLDKAFTTIDQAKANIEKNIANAKELFQSKINNTFNYILECENSRKLGDLLEILTDYHANGSYKILKKNVELKDEEDYAWMVRSTDFEKKFKGNFKYIDEHAYNYLKKSKIFGGEIIISKIGNAGKVYVMPEIDRPCSLAMNLFLLRLKKSEMSSEFLYYYLQSTKGEKQILSKLNGTATKTITKASVRDLNIPFVELHIQGKTVKEFEKLKVEVDKIIELFDAKLYEIEDLKKSILQKAFAGELTSPEGTKYSKDGRSPSEQTHTNKNPVRV